MAMLFLSSQTAQTPDKMPHSMSLYESTPFDIAAFPNILVNSEDPDEMQHNALFAKIKTTFRDRNTLLFRQNKSELCKA